MGTSLVPGAGRWEDLHPGESFGPLGYTITECDTNAFLNAVGLPVETYRGLAAGKDAVPPTLAATDYSPLLRSRLQQFVGMHAKHSLKLLHPLPVGKAVEVEGVVIETYVRRGRKYLVFEYRLHDRSVVYEVNRITTTIDGYVSEEVMEENTPIVAVSDTISPGVPTDAGGPPAPDNPPARVVAPAVHSSRVWQQTITQEAMSLFAELPARRLSGSSTAVRNHHTDPAIARRMGLRGTVAQALHYGAFITHLMLEEAGASFLAGGELNIVFLLPVYAEDTVTIRLEPGAGTRDEFAIRCMNQRAQLVAFGNVGTDVRP